MIEEGMRNLGVEIDDVGSASADTRILRLSLGVLKEYLPSSLETPELGEALQQLHGKLCEAELQELQAWACPANYLIIRPINLVDPPDCQTIEKIVSAVKTLNELGMIAFPGFCCTKTP